MYRAFLRFYQHILFSVTICKNQRKIIIAKEEKEEKRNLDDFPTVLNETFFSNCSMVGLKTKTELLCQHVPLKFVIPHMYYYIHMIESKKF